jgi:hypothetical protein
MDVYQDWFAPPEIQATIDRQAAVLRESVGWPHEPVPGIAMILDDEAVLETNGDGRFLNEAVLWEWKTGLARCGVPVRIHLFDDLALPDFPPHRVYYFPNLFKIDAARRRLLEEKVLRNGHVVVWGPGTGISDGTKIGPEAAAAVTGFAFDMLAVNDHRRTLLADIAHPLTKGLSPATVLGGPLAYGPVLLPTDGHVLGHAWTKLGRNLAGLAVKERPAADGSTWTTLDTREANRGGFGGGPFDIREIVAGGREVWVRARLTASKSWPEDGLIHAQFLRSDPGRPAERPFRLTLTGPDPAAKPPPGDTPPADG